MGDRTFKRVYVWELPVRIFHWTNALCIFVLIVTGLIIADPPAIMSAHEASGAFWFGTVRFIHFAAAYVFVAAIIMRTYWAFVGNRYSRWKAYIPITKKAWKNIFHVLRVDIFLLPRKKNDHEPLEVGHNVLAASTYTGLALLSLVMIFTGFGLYADNSTWFLPKLFKWVSPMLGGDIMTRMVHHATMWLIVIFTIIHVYLVLFHEWLEGRGNITSMLSGYKYVRSERMEHKEKEEKKIEEPVH